MATFSLSLPDPLAKASRMAASRLGISRTQFIRQAIAHELEKLQLQLEQEAIIASFSAMKKNKRYLKEADEIMEDLNAILPKDGDEWWKKK